MKKTALKKKTTVGTIDAEILAYTAGQDVELDLCLVEADCLGTAAHVTMLSRMPVRPPIVTRAECRAVLAELGRIARDSSRGLFKITLDDQDVHLAIERRLTKVLGDVGKKVHTGRSRNDQVATDLRLFAKEQILGCLGEIAAAADALLRLARTHKDLPMAGRTHMQPAMPSSVGLWASAYAEELLDDAELLIAAYAMNNRCPLGSAASYGVPLPIDRKLVAGLLGFERPIHNVLYANNARGKIESVILSAMGQVMLTLSRLAQDLILFSMPEFGYFSLPAEYCTGSSIMPQKKNPDVLELMRAKAAMVLAAASGVAELLRGAPSGYNRDLQEAKGPFLAGLAATRASLRIAARVVDGVKPDRAALLAGFEPGVYATDRALELVGGGMPFRDAYNHVKAHLAELQHADPARVVARKRHWGAPAGLDFAMFAARVKGLRSFVAEAARSFQRAKSRLLNLR